MTDTLLALIPTYGLWLVFTVVAVSCLAVPLPSSGTVLAAGAFASTGDLVLWQVAGVAFGGFAVGDQLAYQIGRSRGTRVLARLRRRATMARPIDRAEAMITKRGPMAVFLSRTVISPLGPFMTYLAAAGGLRWGIYTAAAVPGAAIWAIGYAVLGYGVTDNLTQSTSLLWNGLGVLAAFSVFLGALWWLRRAVRTYQAKAQLHDG